MDRSREAPAGSGARVRVLHVVATLGAHGAGVTAAVGELLRAQRRIGLDVAVLEGDALPNPRSRGSWRGLGFVARAWREIGDADVVHVHALWLLSTWIATHVALLRDKPYVVTPHGMLDPWALSQSAFKKRVARLLAEDRLLSRAGCIQALCGPELAAIRRLEIRSPVAIVPPGVDPGLLEQRSSSRDDDPYVLFLGRLHPKKGIDVLLRAFSTVTTRTRWRLVIAGPDEVGYREELERLARELGIESCTEFVGAVEGDRKLALLRGASAFALASHSEGLPVAVLEAMAAGIPVAISSACNLAEVADVGAGFVAPAATESFSAVLSRAMTLEPAARVAMGERGRALVRERFTTTTGAAQLRAVYEWLCRGGAAPAIVMTGGSNP